MAVIDRPHILFDNRLDDGVPTATTTDADTQYNVLNLKDWRSYTFWKASTTATHHISIDALVAKTANSVAIIAHDLFTQGATVAVEWSDNGTAWSVAMAPIVVPSNKAFFRKFTPSTHRYWRLVITGMTAPAFIGILVIGERLTMEQYIEGQYNPDAETLKLHDAVSDDGQLLGTIQSHTNKDYKANFRAISTAWINATFKPAWDLHISKGKPFFWIWNITDYPDDVQLVRIKNKGKLNMPFRNLSRNLSIDFVGVKE